MSDAHNTLIWPLPLRLIHWSLGICVLVAWVTPNTYETPHRIAGYTALALVGLRILIGIMGPQHVRFTYMFRMAKGAFSYIRRSAGKSARPAQLGLNPVGAVMAFTLLSLLLVCGATG